MAKLGVTHPHELVGRTELVVLRKDARKFPMNFSRYTQNPYSWFTAEALANIPNKACNDPQPVDHSVDSEFAEAMIEAAIEGRPHSARGIVGVNSDRTAFTQVIREVARQGHPELEHHSMEIRASGCFGQSTAAFATDQFAIHIEGGVSDGAFKSGTGFLAALSHAEDAAFDQIDSVVAGNTLGYGARGKIFADGLVGERVGILGNNEIVINIGGAHALEYALGGTLVALGKKGEDALGINAFAGSNADGFVWDESDRFPNFFMSGAWVTARRLEKGSDDDKIARLKTLVERHQELTNSVRAKEILDDWDRQIQNFWYVEPKVSEELARLREMFRDDYEALQESLGDPDAFLDSEIVHGGKPMKRRDFYRHAEGLELAGMS